MFPTRLSKRRIVVTSVAAVALAATFAAFTASSSSPSTAGKSGHKSASVAATPQARLDALWQRLTNDPAVIVGPDASGGSSGPGGWEWESPGYSVSDTAATYSGTEVQVGRAQTIVTGWTDGMPTTGPGTYPAGRLAVARMGGLVVLDASADEGGPVTTLTDPVVLADLPGGGWSVKWTTIDGSCAAEAITGSGCPALSGKVSVIPAGTITGAIMPAADGGVTVSVDGITETATPATPAEVDGVVPVPGHPHLAECVRAWPVFPGRGVIAACYPSALELGTNAPEHDEARALPESSLPATNLPTVTCEGTPDVPATVCTAWQRLSAEQRAVIGGVATDDSDAATPMASFAPLSVTFSPDGLSATITGCNLVARHGKLAPRWVPGRWTSERLTTSPSATWYHSSAEPTIPRGVSCSTF